MSRKIFFLHLNSLRTNLIRSEISPVVEAGDFKTADAELNKVYQAILNGYADIYSEADIGASEYCDQNGQANVCLQLSHF